ncbi:hypothetical protein Q7A53_06130 [Halobacillus rhizosphaerae]|uniref:hypothetical protein n=1 Tax=Halobacillus rhizosphaerae TaxID=3064889 RepID=UPI00398B8DA9
MSEEVNQELILRKNAMSFDRNNFGRLIISDLSKSRRGRGVLKKYKQSEVREIIEGYKLERNQRTLREISNLLYAKSPQYQRLLKHFSDMALFAHVINPIRDIRKSNKSKVEKQYIEIAELIKMMNLPHEMKKLLRIAFKEDVFYGYIHREKRSFYIQNIEADICKITSVEDGVYNFSIDMSFFLGNEKLLSEWATEVQVKFREWKAMKEKNSKIGQWVELNSRNTIVIKVNEEFTETFPPFAGSFDAIYDIEAFKQLRKDKEELGNYMILSQELPIRQNSDNNNDFMIDKDTMMFFHNLASNTVPENVGVITSPMPISPIKFDKDRVDSDGVAKAERDFWAGSGTSQLLFNADKSTSQGLLMSIRTDEEIVFGVLTQIERWVNRYLKSEYPKDLMFSLSILHVTHFNRDDMYKMYLESAQYGVPVKNELCAVVGKSPIETMNSAYLENDILKLHEKFIPLQSSHTMNGDEIIGKPKAEDGRPAKKAKDASDETNRNKDKPNA